MGWVRWDVVGLCAFLGAWVAFFAGDGWFAVGAVALGCGLVGWVANALWVAITDR